MGKTMIAIPGFCLCLLFFSCGEGSDSQTSSTPQVTGSSIQGSWASGCFERNGAKIRTTMSFSDQTYETTSQVYLASGTCTSAHEILNVRETGTFSLGDDMGSGNTAIDYSSQSLRLTPLNEAGIDAVNLACASVSESQVRAETEGKELEILADPCHMTMRVPPFGLVKIDGVTLFTGNTEALASQDGSSAEKRPANIAAALPFKK